MNTLNLRKKYRYFLTVSPNKNDHNFNDYNRPSKIIEGYQHLKKSIGPANIYCQIEIDNQSVGFHYFSDLYNSIKINQQFK